MTATTVKKPKPISAKKAAALMQALRNAKPAPAKLTPKQWEAKRAWLADWRARMYSRARVAENQGTHRTGSEWGFRWN